MTRSLPFALSLALVALASGCPGCPGDDTPDGGPVDVGLTAADIKELCVIYSVGYANFTNSILHQFMACSAADRFEAFDDDVMQEVEDGCVEGNGFYDMFATAAEGERVDIDMGRVRACLQKGRTARESVSIQDYNLGETALSALFDDADCQGAITPRVGQGGECVQGWDCVEGTYCQAEPPDEAGLRCLTLAGDGERCSSSARFCDEDLSCTVDEVCAPGIAEGQDCLNDALERDCVVGTFCDADDTGLCQPLLAANAECTADEQCASGLACTEVEDFNTGEITPGTCEEPPALIADGQACDVDLDFCEKYCSVCRPGSSGGATQCLDRAAAGGYCEDDDHCRTGLCEANECAEPPAVDLPNVGESCAQTQECEDGACVAGTCVAGVEGDACDIDDPQCEGDLICAGAPAECTPAPPAGQACLEEQCDFDAYCDESGQCVALKEAGEGCEIGDECRSGECLLNGECATPGTGCEDSREFFIQCVTLGLLLPLVRRLRRRRR